MSRRLGSEGVVGGGFPRVSGDEPPAYSDAKINEVFSPRERG